MTDATKLVQEALDFGFSHAAAMDPSRLRVRDEVRAMCAVDRCRAYGRSWCCPPACGTLDHFRRLFGKYHSGLLVQTSGDLDDPYDYDTIVALGELQKQRLQGFRSRLRDRYPRLLPLGNGACTICVCCTYPDAPCRDPEVAVVSMEAAGLVVTDVCIDSGLGYYYGPSTMTYTGCYLLK